jgi:putative hemolysin
MSTKKLELTVKPASQNPTMIIIVAMGVMVILAIVSFGTGFNTAQDNIIPSTTERTMMGTTQMANPASTNCVDQGGTLTITPDQVGMCKLPSGKTCEEWALFRGEC